MTGRFWWATVLMPVALAAQSAPPAPGGASLAPRSASQLASASPWPEQEFAVTRHRFKAGGRTLDYTARAGTVPLFDHETGELVARVFLVSYALDRPAGAAPRPLTFLWNGGPGANAADLHLVGFGPKGLDAPPTFPEWAGRPPMRLADRDPSWLLHSDLVFVDPVGTGYSRALSEARRQALNTTRGDVEAVAEAIRVYRTRFDAWDQPLLIAGESYGTTRAMGVADALERRRVHLAGVILISGDYEAGQRVPPALETALRLPMLTAAAHFHRRLPDDLQAGTQAAAVASAERWARATYAPALERRASLSPAERAAVVAGLARFTGLTPTQVDAGTLAVAKDRFADLLLADRGLSLGRYDLRVTGPARPPGVIWTPTTDPGITPVLDEMQGNSAVVIRYLRDELGYRSDLLYRGPFGEGWHPLPLEDVTGGAAGPLGGIYADWTTLQFKMERPAAAPGAMPPLARAMARNPGLLVWNVTGLYDGSCAAADEAVAHTPEPLRARVRNGCYAAGHMVYSDAQVRRRLADDFGRFVADAVARRRAVPGAGR